MREYYAREEFRTADASATSFLERADAAMICAPIAAELALVFMRYELPCMEADMRVCGGGAIYSRILNLRVYMRDKSSFAPNHL